MSWTTENSGGSLRVVVTKELPGQRWREVLREADCEIVVGASRDALSVEEVREAIGTRCDGAIGQLTEPWGAELFGALEAAGGRAYSNYAVGYDNVRVPEATQRGIPVGNTPGVLTETTAEMAATLTFAAARRVVESDVWLRAGNFRGWLPDLFLGARLAGGTLGVVGAGRIGSAYAMMIAPGCGMNLLYADAVRNESLEARFAAVVDAFGYEGDRRPTCRQVELDELLAQSDIVSLHTPLTDDTRHLIDATRLARMKDDAVLVNTSRGPVVDEAALVAHLRAQPEFRVGLDVFEAEPALEPGLAEQPNAVIVPHIASATKWTREGMATLAACNVAAILRGDPVAAELDVTEFLEGDVARKAPSIVNAEELGLPRA